MTYSLELERLLAARWAGIRWEEFQEMEGEDQAVIIAGYRIEQHMNAVLLHRRRSHV